MAKAHAMAGSAAASIAKQVTDLTQGFKIGSSFGITSTMCPGHSTPLSLKVHAHSISKISLTCSLVPRPPLESGITSLSSRVTQPFWDINTSLSE